MTDGFLGNRQNWEFLQILVHGYCFTHGGRGHAGLAIQLSGVVAWDFQRRHPLCLCLPSVMVRLSSLSTAVFPLLPFVARSAGISAEGPSVTY